MEKNMGKRFVRNAMLIVGSAVLLRVSRNIVPTYLITYLSTYLTFFVINSL